MKSLAGLLTMSVPGPTLVRPMLPVIFEATVTKPAVLAFHWWKIRSKPFPEVIEPPWMVTALAPTVGVMSTPPEATVRPPVASRVTGFAELKRSALTEIGAPPMVAKVPLSTFAPAA